MHIFEHLNEVLIEAKKYIEIGALYYHYRTPNQLYKVLTVALDERTEKPCVVYQALYGEQLIWVRAVEDWCAPIECEGKIVARFTRYQ